MGRHRARTAKKTQKLLDRAEELGWKLKWEDDPEGWDSFDEKDREGLAEVLYCVLKDENGNVLGSLGGVGFLPQHGPADARRDREFGRTIEADLVDEALHELKIKL